LADNIKVKFYETSESGSILWEDYGVFNESDVHHQYGIVLKTPPYKNQSIEKTVVVQLQLFRPSDSCTSDSIEFRFKPNIHAGQKRRRSDSIDLIPTVINSHETNSEKSNFHSFSVDQNQDTSQSFGDKSYQSDSNQNFDMEESLFLNETLTSYIGNFSASQLSFSSNDFKGLCQVSPEEFCRLLDIDFCDSKIEIDAVGSKKVKIQEEPSTSASLMDIKCSLLDKLKMLIKLFRSNFDADKLREMIMVLISAQAETGENLLLDCIEFNGTNDEIKNLILILIKYKLLDVLQSVNDLDQNCFHLLIRSGRSSLLKVFSSLGVNINQMDVFGNTPLHTAVMVDSQDSVNELLEGSSAIELDELNDEGFSPLHIAVKNNNFKIVKLLIEAGADVKKMSPPTGCNVVHMALEFEEVNMEMVNYLIACDEQLLQQENNARMNVLQFASENNRDENVISHLATFYEEEYAKVCESEEEESESDSDENDESTTLLFDEKCLNDLCVIFDDHQKWEGLLILMELEDKIDEWKSLESPSRCLFKYLEVRLLLY
jgi:nuclear factor NF-kappa-B p105 subunit